MLTSARERDLWRVVSHENGGGFSIDVSQSIHRCARGSGDVLPTITPHGRVVVADRPRLMVPAEKLLIHGFPLHRMRRPRGLSDTALSLLGGNTMHVQCVAAAMLIGLAQVNWSSLERVPRRQAACPQAPERAIAINVALL